VYPPPWVNVRILLIINIRRKKRGFYPTMFLIMSKLGQKHRNLLLYFHQDRMRRKEKNLTNGGRTHDVYDRK
jgi:hypothetical protein